MAGTRDYELRIPTRIRSIVINNAAGTEDGQITVRRPSSPRDLKRYPSKLSTCRVLAAWQVGC